MTMFNQFQSQTLTVTAVNAPVCLQLTGMNLDRWYIHHRLQELAIASHCLPNGSLWIEIINDWEALVVCAVIKTLNTSRSELIDWLEVCWQL